MSMKTISRAVVGALLAAATVSFADDIDLYVGGEQVTGAETNVVIFLDNSANWSNASGWPATQGEAELDALKAVIDTLNDSINVGVMMHTRTGTTSGAYVRFAVRPMNATNRAKLKEVFDDIKSTAPNAPQDKVAQSADGDHAIEEVFRYFNSKALGFTAARDTKEDYTNNTAYYDVGGGVSAALDTKANPASALGTHAYATSAATTYSGPASSNAGCAKNYLVWIGNTSLDGSTDTSRLTAAAALIGETASTTQISVSGNSQPGSVMIDEWARFMYQYGVPTTIDDPARPGHKKMNKIITYAVDTFPADPAPTACIGDTTGGAQQIGQHYVMQSVATAGGGKCYPAANTSQLSVALAKIFSEIQAVNSVFASASLPVSVNTQGTFENQIYIGMFRPDSSARPRWLGNLKEYKFARYCDENSNDKVDSGEAIADNVTNPTCSSTDKLKLFLADRNNNPAVDQRTTAEGGTGFLDLNAVSHWTTEQSPGFWSFFPDPVAGTDDSPDGPLVERGGAAFKLRNQFASGRNLYTCLGTCLSGAAGTSLNTQTFTTSNTTITGMLNPGGKSVTLARSGNTVTATASAAHGFAVGDTVTITGATTPAEYLGAKTIVSVPTSTTFTFGVTEMPLDDTGNAKVSVAQGSFALADIDVTVSDWTTGAATATSQTNPGGYVVGDTLLITGGSQSYVNSAAGGATVNAAGGGTFSYALTVPVPVSPATTAGVNSIGGTDRNSASVQRQENLVVVDAGSRVDNVITPGLTTVTLKNVVPTEYNVVGRTIEQEGTDCNNLVAGWAPVPTTGSDRQRYFCFRLFTLTNSTATAQKILDPQPVNITRSVGSQVATATLKNAASPNLSGSTLTISGSVGYDGAWALGGAYPGGDPAGAGTFAIAADGRSFTFGPITLSPGAPSGTYTATPGLATTTVAAANLINWVRGMDVVNDENQNNSFTDVRASIHADVLHSRPLMFNYGGSTGVVGYYGSNDGLLHAIKGGTTDSDGNELWAFIPEEFVSYSKLSRLYLNEPQVRFPNLLCGITPAPTQRDYFWDGVMSGYQTPDGTASTAPSKSLLFAAMRRGGRAVYALNVTDPANPKFQWRITNASTGYSDLGQTWSEVKPIRLKGVESGSGVTKQAVVFGAGYDPTEEDKPSGSLRSPTMGRGVYVADMDTGALLAFLQPPASVKKYSFTADVTPVDVDGDGNVDRIYAVDTGGNLFRFDADQTAAPGTTWTTYHLAKLGDVDDNGGTDARKFLFAPAVAPTLDIATGQAAYFVAMGSGDREKPLKHPVTVTCPAYYGGSGTFGAAVQDRFYSILDKVQIGSDPTTINASPIVESNLIEVNANPNSLTAFDMGSTAKGWYISLKNETDATTTLDEEKTVNSPQVVGGVMFFATNTPQRPDTSLGICSNLGQALGYAVDPYTGLPAFNRDNTSGTTKAVNYAATLTGGGLSPTVTSGVVMIGGKPYYGIIGGGGGGVEGGVIRSDKVNQNPPGMRKKVYWFYRAD
ncbi:PilC/PilY family type IV pilus protein [Azospira restricta]|uniref:PilY1 beta-propeller domain-containing protein n=1 Tax=Azospira restricta TaxID=404405 RepID=A0A974PXS9_9RHOO|nr:PilC/PilY family type IV pilus protein [Azospira restricta]QRJ63422.1 hypothetical protein IWH25_17010 [Azospira restricta]